MIPFAPLFTKDPTVHYSFDTWSIEDRRKVEPLSDGRPATEVKSEWKLWLSCGYDDAVLNKNANFQTDVAFMFVGLGSRLPDPSGGLGGYEGSLGKQCATAVTDLFKQKLSERANLCYVGVDVRRKYYLNHETPNVTAEELGCPVDMFNNWEINVDPNVSRGVMHSTFTSNSHPVNQLR